MGARPLVPSLACVTCLHACMPSRCVAAPWKDVDCLRLEPMLACMLAGFWLCNGLGRRAQMSSLLHSCLPPLLAFFFFTTGISMRVQLLRHTWLPALTLFSARIAALWLGTYSGTSLASLVEPFGTTPSSLVEVCVRCNSIQSMRNSKFILLRLSNTLNLTFNR